MGEIIVTGESREELLEMLEGVPKERAIDLTPLPRDQCFSFEQVEAVLKRLVPNSAGDVEAEDFGWINGITKVDRGYLMALSDVRRELRDAM